MALGNGGDQYYINLHYFILRYIMIIITEVIYVMYMDRVSAIKIYYIIIIIVH